MNRILFVPGKNPKPPIEEYRQQLLRCLRRGVERVDPAVAQAIGADSSAFQVIGWNRLYYQVDKPLDEDLPWIEALLTQDGPTRQDVREALSIRSRIAWVLYTLADAFNVLIPLLPDPAVRATIQETARYFSKERNIGRQVRELVKAPLREMFARGERVLLIGHSMGSIVAYDALWELTHIEKNPGCVDVFLTLGSPLGMRFTQKRLLGAQEEGRRRFPHNIDHWINMASQGDLTALDAGLRDDYTAMLTLGVIQSIADVNGGIFNFFRTDLGLNVHRSYGYLVNPRVGEVIATWWKADPARPLET